MARWIMINDTRYRVDLLTEDFGDQQNVLKAIANLFDVPHKPIEEIDFNEVYLFD